MKKALGQEYSTNRDIARKVLPLFIPDWPKAIRNAERVRQHHLDAQTQEPANPSTEIDQLVKDLNSSAPEHARKALD